MFQSKLMRLLLLFSMVMFLFGMVQFIACGDDDDDNDDNDDNGAAVIWPLANGNTWVMTLYDSTDTAVATVTYSITGTETVNGTMTYRVDFGFDPFSEKETALPITMHTLFRSPHPQKVSTMGPASVPAEEYAYWLNHSDGLYEYGWYYNGDLEIYDAPLLVFKYPVSSGESFMDGWDQTWNVGAIDTQVSVPAGNFTCVDYGYTSVVQDFHRFMSPNAGIIKDLDNEAGMKAELTSYTLN